MLHAECNFAQTEQNRQGGLIHAALHKPNIKMRELLLSAVATMAVSPVMAANVNVWTGEHAVTWENTLSVEAGKFADASIGDKLVVKIAEGATDVMELKSRGTWLPGSILTRLDGRTEVSAYITQGMQAYLQNFGLELCGPSFTVTSVDIETATGWNVPADAIWSGLFWVDGAWNTLELYKSAFNEQNPNQIIINFSDEFKAETAVINVLTAWDNEDMKLSTSEAMTIEDNKAIIDLSKLPKPLAEYLEGGNALMIQGHVDGDNPQGFNIQSVEIKPYATVTEVRDVEVSEGREVLDVYSVSGQIVRIGVEAADALDGLPAGVYIAGGKKYTVR